MVDIIEAVRPIWLRKLPFPTSHPPRTLLVDLLEPPTRPAFICTVRTNHGWHISHFSSGTAENMCLPISSSIASGFDTNQLCGFRFHPAQEASPIPVTRQEDLPVAGPAGAARFANRYLPSSPASR